MLPSYSWCFEIFDSYPNCLRRTDLAWVIFSLERWWWRCRRVFCKVHQIVCTGWEQRDIRMFFNWCRHKRLSTGHQDNGSKYVCRVRASVILFLEVYDRLFQICLSAVSRPGCSLSIFVLRPCGSSLFMHIICLTSWTPAGVHIVTVHSKSYLVQASRSFSALVSRSLTEV